MAAEDAKRRFREVALPHLDDAYSLARWLSGSRTDAEDIVQEAALRALAALETTVPLKARAWWLSVVRNTALTWLQRHRPKTLAFVGDLDDVAALEAGDPAPDPEAALIASDEGERVRQAIASLPSPLRETLVLREIDELDYREIAEATEAPIGTVMSRLSRARAALARKLGAKP
jgi:RNA polymerase sigma-70 factor (ECF subfamily)